MIHKSDFLCDVLACQIIIIQFSLKQREYLWQSDIQFLIPILRICFLGPILISLYLLFVAFYQEQL